MVKFWVIPDYPSSETLRSPTWARARFSASCTTPNNQAINQQHELFRTQFQLRRPNLQQHRHNSIPKDPIQLADWSWYQNSHRTSINKEHINTLCVWPTGGEKSILFTTTAAPLKGITLCIMLLLSLGANQAKELIMNTTLSITSSSLLWIRLKIWMKKLLREKDRFYQKCWSEASGLLPALSLS